MGILNITPDSFHDGGRHQMLENALAQTEKMLAEGADFIDVGAQSTRPGAEVISAQKEWERLQPVVASIAKKHPKAILSVDTFYAEVAKNAVAEGAQIINDVSGGTLDPLMFKTVAHLQVPYILMHMRGTPQNMQSMAHYKNVVAEVIRELSIKVNTLRQLGVNDVLIDPGFGFAKTTEQNFELLKNLSAFNIFEAPILVGVSRKGMIYKTLKTIPEQALNGTTTLHAFALQNGANILRVHDVKQAKEVVSLHQMLNA